MSVSRYNPDTGLYDVIDTSEDIVAYRQARLKTFAGIFTETELEIDDGFGVLAARIDDASSDVHEPDMNLPVIDLKKEQPVTVKDLMANTFKLKDVTYETAPDLYERNCMGYELKNGMLYIQLRMTNQDAKNLEYRKKMLRRVRITHYDEMSGLDGVEPFAFDYVVQFSHIEAAAYRERYEYEDTHLRMTLVYKIEEW